jgi:hypothetical protein
LFPAFAPAVLQTDANAGIGPLAFAALHDQGSIIMERGFIFPE